MNHEPLQFIKSATYQSTTSTLSYKLALTMASTTNSKSSRNTRYPAIAMQQYLDTDIRRQCQKSTHEKSNVIHKSTHILSRWSGKDKSTDSRSIESFPLHGVAYHQQTRQGGGFRDPGCNLFPRSSSVGLSASNCISASSIVRARERSFSLNDHPRGKTNKYGGLTTSQKAEIVIKDDMQWHKLQQSLRDADGVWKLLGMRQVIDAHLQKRLEEMERLEEALREQIGPIQNDLSEHSASMETLGAQEEVGVVGTVKKFARRASTATHNYLVHQNKNSKKEHVESALNGQNEPWPIHLSEHSAVETKREIGVVGSGKKILRRVSLATHDALLDRNKNSRVEHLEPALSEQKNGAILFGVNDHSAAVGSVKKFMRRVSFVPSSDCRSSKMQLSESAGRNGSKDKNGKVERVALSREPYVMQHTVIAADSANVEKNEEVGVVGTTAQNFQPNDLANRSTDDGNKRNS